MSVYTEDFYRALVDTPPAKPKWVDPYGKTSNLTPPDPRGELTAFGKGIRAFGDEVQATGGGLTAMAGQALANVMPDAVKPYAESMRDWGQEVYKRNMAESVAGSQAPTAAMQDIGNVKSISDFGDYAAYQLGKGLPNLALMAAPGIGWGGLAARGVGAGLKEVAAGAAAKTAAKAGLTGAAAKTAVDDGVELALKTSAAKMLKGQAFNKGMMKGSFASSLGYEGGMAYGDMTTGEDAVKPNDALLPALGVGVVNGLIEMAEWGMAAKFLGIGQEAVKKSVIQKIKEAPELSKKLVEIAKGVTVGAAGGMAVEGAQEGLQELVNIAGERWAKDEGLFDKMAPEDWSRIKNAAAAGGLVGGVAGGIGGPFRGSAAGQVDSTEDLNKQVELAAQLGASLNVPKQQADAAQQAAAQQAAQQSQKAAEAATKAKEAVINITIPGAEFPNLQTELPGPTNEGLIGNQTFIPGERGPIPEARRIEEQGDIIEGEVVRPELPGQRRLPGPGPQMGAGEVPPRPGPQPQSPGLPLLQGPTPENVLLDEPGTNRNIQPTEPPPAPTVPAIPPAPPAPMAPPAAAAEPIPEPTTEPAPEPLPLVFSDRGEPFNGKSQATAFRNRKGIKGEVVPYGENQFAIQPNEPWTRRLDEVELAPNELVRIEEDPRIQDPEIMQRVRDLATQIGGWQETGGRLIRDEEGKPVNRTVWVPKDERWLDRPKDVKPEHIKNGLAKIEKIIEQGQPLALPARERRAVTWLFDQAATDANSPVWGDGFDAEQIANPAQPDGYGLDTTGTEETWRQSPAFEGGQGIYDSGQAPVSEETQRIMALPQEEFSNELTKFVNEDLSRDEQISPADVNEMVGLLDNFNSTQDPAIRAQADGWIGAMEQAYGEPVVTTLLNEYNRYRETPYAKTTVPTEGQGPVNAPVPVPANVPANTAGPGQTYPETGAGSDATEGQGSPGTPGTLGQNVPTDLGTDWIAEDRTTKSKGNFVLRRLEADGVPNGFSLENKASAKAAETKAFFADEVEAIEKADPKTPMAPGLVSFSFASSFPDIAAAYPNQEELVTEINRKYYDDATITLTERNAFEGLAINGSFDTAIEAAKGRSKNLLTIWRDDPAKFEEAKKLLGLEQDNWEFAGIHEGAALWLNPKTEWGVTNSTDREGNLKFTLYDPKLKYAGTFDSMKEAKAAAQAPAKTAPTETGLAPPVEPVKEIPDPGASLYSPDNVVDVDKVMDDVADEKGWTEESANDVIKAVEGRPTPDYQAVEELLLKQYQAGNVTRSQYSQLRRKLATQDLDGLYTTLQGITERDPNRDFLPRRKTGDYELDAEASVDFDQLIPLLGRNLYQGGYVETTVKELIQNSFDASRTQSEKSGKNERVNIILNSGARTITVQDTGIGMSPQEVNEFYFRIGGTGKDATETSGGKGIAKVLFLYAAGKINLTTTKDGITSFIETTPKDLFNKKSKIRAYRTPGEPNGTTVTLTVPEEYTDERGNKNAIWFPTSKNSFRAISRPLMGPVDFHWYTSWDADETPQQIVANVNDEDSALDIGARYSPEKHGLYFYTTVSTDHWDADLYFGKERQRYGGSYSVLSRGVHQFDLRLKANDENLPYDVIINVKSRVGTKSEYYPFTNSREEFSPNIEKDVEALKLYITKYFEGKAAQETVQTFKDMKQLPRLVTQGANKELSLEDKVKAAEAMRQFIKDTPQETVDKPPPAKVVIKKGGDVYETGADGKTSAEPVVTANEEKKRELSFKAEKAHQKLEDVVGEAGLDRTKPIFHNNTSADYIGKFGEQAAQFFAEMGTVVLEVMETLGQISTWRFKGFEKGSTTAIFGGVSIDKTYRGLTLRTPSRLFLLNPLSPGKSRSLPGAAHGLYMTIVHEMAHNIASKHEEPFVLALHEVDEMLADRGLDIEFQDKIGDILYKHRNIYNDMRALYERSDTRNLAKPLEEGNKDKLARGGLEDSRSGRTDSREGTADAGVRSRFRERMGGANRTGTRVGGESQAVNKGTGEKLESRKTKTRVVSRAEFEAAVAQYFPEGFLANAEKAGVLVINETSPEGSASGTFDPKTGVMTVNLDRMPIGEDPAGVLLHEGKHRSLREMLGDEQHRKLYDDLVKLAKSGDVVAQQAVARGETFKDEWTKHEEALAYFTQSSTKPTGLWRRIINAIKAWWVGSQWNQALKAKGLDFKLTDELAVALTVRAMKQDKRGMGQQVAAVELPSTISIDGIERSTTDSTGKPIQSTEEGVRNFWKWFGNSTLIDAQGRPQVVYHGTRDSIDAFDLEHPNRKDNGWLGKGVYITDELRLAEAYANLKRGAEDPTVLSLYARLENPYKATVDEKRMLSSASVADIERWTEHLRSKNHDGVILTFNDGTREILVFKPTQVKSATDNQGTFGENDAGIYRSDVLESRVLDAINPFTMPERMRAYIFDPVDSNIGLSRFEHFRQYVQDRFLQMKKKQEGVGGQLPPSQQVYETEAASHGRKKDRVRELQMKYLDPMLRLAAKNGWDLEKDVGNLAYARAALESNERLRLRSAKHFLNELAKAVPAYPARKLKEDWKAMKDLLKNDPVFQAMSPQMRKRTIQQNTYNMLKQAVQDMQQRYPSKELTEFVEAFEAIDRQPTGMTDIDAQHIMTRWQGRADWADMQQLLDLFDQMNRGSITAYVQSGMMTQEMAAQWMGAYQHYATLHREGYERETGGPGMGFSPAKPSKLRFYSAKRAVNVFSNTVMNAIRAQELAENNRVMQTLHNFILAHPDEEFWEVKGKTQVAYLDDDGFVQFGASKAINPSHQALVYINGRMKLIEAKSDNEAALSIIKALNNLSTPRLGPIMQLMMKANRFMASMNTSLSPEFFFINPIRDLLTAQFNWSDGEADQYRKQMLKDIPAAIKSLNKVFAQRRRNEPLDMNDPWTQWVRAYEQSGATTGWLDVFETAQDQKEALEKRMKQLAPGMNWHKSLHEIGQWIEDHNAVMENAVRLVTFKALVRDINQPAVPLLRAANVAKDLTVNFNRRGTAGPAINALWMFAGAGIQGSARIIMALKNRKVQKMVGAAVVVSILVDQLNRMLDDDDEYDKIPEHVKQRNLVFKNLTGVGPSYFTVPAPWGYNLFWYIGQKLSEGIAVQGGYGPKGWTPAKAGWDIAFTGYNAFMPVQGETVAQALSPTVFDPIIQIAENKDAFSRQLRPEPFPGEVKPRTEQHWSNASDFSVSAAKLIGAMTGGDDVTAGGIDLSPEWLDAIGEQALGAVGRQLKDFGWDFTLAPALGLKEFEPEQLPVIRKFTAFPTSGQETAIYHDRVAQVMDAQRRMSAYTEGARRNPEEARALRQESGELLRMADYTKDVEKQLKSIRQRMRLAESRGDSAGVKMLKDRMDLLRKRYNDTFERRVGG